MNGDRPCRTKRARRQSKIALNWCERGDGKGARRAPRLYTNRSRGAAWNVHCSATLR
jgi:hypothetical protein